MTYRVDHRIRYMPELAMALTERYIQKSTSMTRRSQGPVCGMPYWQMLTEMTPMLSRQLLFRVSVFGVGDGVLTRRPASIRLVPCCSPNTKIATHVVEGRGREARNSQRH